jgi:hypothetical protein
LLKLAGKRAWLFQNLPFVGFTQGGKEIAKQIPAKELFEFAQQKKEGS